VEVHFGAREMRRFVDDVTVGVVVVAVVEIADERYHHVISVFLHRRHHQLL